MKVPKQVFYISVLAAVTIVLGAIGCSPAKWHETQGAPPSAAPPAPLPPAASIPERVCGHRLPQVGQCDVGTARPSSPTGTNRDTPKGPTPSQAQTPASNHTAKRPSDSRSDQQRGPGPAPGPAAGQDHQPHPEDPRSRRFFVVQNIATEKLRVYETRCLGGCKCKHSLIIETDMSVGPNVAGRQTMVGSYRVSHWEKFFQNSDLGILPWYSPELPPNPQLGAPLAAWTETANRGAYGWFTALLVPNAGQQWLHGSWGWGKDNDSARLLAEGKYLANAQSPRLSAAGGTGIENRAIALLRELLVPGTQVIRIYARETYRDRPRTASTKIGTWRYALTSETADEAPGADRKAVQTRHVPEQSWLEQGVFRFKAGARAIALKQTPRPHADGNVYRIPETSFQGFFLVDEGHVVNYRHPRELPVGGQSGELPSVLMPHRCESH